MQGSTRKIFRRIVLLTVAAVIGGAAFVLLPAFGQSHNGPPQKDMKIDQAIRVEVIEAVIANLNQRYVFPEKAAAMEKQLRLELKNGDYDDVTSAEKLATVLSESLQKHSQDKHLGMRYFEKEIPLQNRDAELQAQTTERQAEDIRQIGRAHV